jgi:hypothetical protein
MIRKTNLSALILGALLLVFLAGCPLEAGDSGSNEAAGPPSLTVQSVAPPSSSYTPPLQRFYAYSGVEDRTLNLADYIPANYGDTTTLVKSTPTSTNIIHSVGTGTVTIKKPTNNEMVEFEVGPDSDEDGSFDSPTYTRKLTIIVSSNPLSGEFTFIGGASNRTLITYSGSATTLVAPAVDENNDPLYAVGKADAAGSTDAVSISSVTTLVLPETVTVIHPHAFDNNTTLQEIYAPGVTSVGEAAFKGATSLTNVYLPKAVSIGNTAFSGASALADVYFPAVTTIGKNAFEDVDLEEIYFPKAVSIGDTAFKGVATPTSVYLPEAASIGKNAFENATGLTEVSLPKVTSIGDNAFKGVSTLTKVSLPAVQSIGADAFIDIVDTSFKAITISGRANIGNVTGTPLWKLFVDAYKGAGKEAGTYAWDSGLNQFCID